MTRLISDIGEFALIERIAKKARVDKSVVKGIGDDTAVIRWNSDKYLLVTTDMLVQDVHFRLKDASFFRIGWKSLAVNISDIAAMGGLPRYAVVSVGLPRRLSVRNAEEIYQGIQKLAAKFKINIVGGDTNRAQKLVINITLLGEVKKKNLVLRSGARMGDAIFVTGCLGGALMKKHLDFMPRVREAQVLVRRFKLNAMIDISDGLAGDLERISGASNVGAVVYEECIPLFNEAKSINDALFSGEDFELLFTMPEREAKRLRASPPKNISLTEIGKIVHKRQGLKIINRCGRERLLPPKGFRHF